ncbi:MAG: FAD-binding oxidoreductase [Acidiferrobacterales bacterium]
MAQTELPASFLTELRKHVGAERVLTDAADCWVYGQDNSRKHTAPAGVVLAENHRQVVNTVQQCYEHGIPLTVRGRATGTAGGAIPESCGIVLSLERMNKILHVDADNRLMKVEAGVLNQSVQDAASPHDLFWSPDPTSAAFCTVGGNVAVNAAGPRALKYGTTRDNVLGLRAVTGKGEVIQTGVNTTKGVVGYDLTRLIIGSEGTLAVVTEATLKLQPEPETIRLLQAIYRDIESATRAIVAIMKQPNVPRSLEFIDHAAIEMVHNYSGTNLPKDAGAMLLVEADGPDAGIKAILASISLAARNEGLVTLSEASSDTEKQQLWAARKALSPALRNVAPNKLNEDVVVPVSRIPELVSGLDQLARQYGIPIVNFGHAGNGNIHVNLLYDSQDTEQDKQARPCLEAVFALVLKLGGTLSGEHGIGLEKRDYVGLEIDPVTLDLMRRIKCEFDPRNVLNPGKMFPPDKSNSV